MSKRGKRNHGITNRDFKFGPTAGVTARRDETNIWPIILTYGYKPHFVPPSFNPIGFFMCDPPADLVAMHYGYVLNSTPWDEHPDEWTLVEFVVEAFVEKEEDDA